MWMTFGLAALFAIVAFYLPGWMALKPLGLKQGQSFIFAPCASLSFYIVLVFVCSAAGIFMTGCILFAGGCCIALVLGILGFVVRRGARKEAKEATALVSRVQQVRLFLHGERHLFLYVAAGVVLTAFFFVRNLDGPDSFAQLSDNVYHLSLIRSYVESGNWSPLASTIFPEEAWTISASFYPSLFHIMGAMVVSFLSVPIALAQNAVIATIIAVVFPVSIFQFVRTVFPDRSDVLFYGAFVMLGFAAFPWMFLVFGPLHSNLLSFAIAPLALSAFILALAKGASRSRRVIYGALFVLCFVAMAVAQTNACFTVGVILLPYCFVRIWEASKPATMPARRYGPIVAFAIATIALWCICFNLPFLRGVVNHTWPAFSSLSQTPINMLFLAFKDSAAQVFLGAVLLIGIVSLCHLKKNRWLIWSYGIFCVLYVVCALTDGPIKQFLAGFWYTDGYRIAASAVICAIPIAAVGLMRLARFVQFLLRSFSRDNGESWSGRYVGAGIVLGLLLLLNYYPNYIMPGSDEEVRSGIGQTADRINKTYASGEPYTPQEQAFVEQAHAIVGDDAVLNFPFDGSALSFAEEGLNTIFRQFDAGDLTIRKAMRERLPRVAEDEDVQSELDSYGVRYLLLLDQGKNAGKGYFGYDSDEWTGIEAITDDTPGLKLLLSEGDMRLYEIER